MENNQRRPTGPKMMNRRIVPIPNVLVAMVKGAKKRDGCVFDSTDLRKECDAATAVCGFEGLLVHDLRRSAIRNMMLAGAQ
jgi:hypothetical protein